MPFKKTCLNYSIFTLYYISEETLFQSHFHQAPLVPQLLLTYDSKIPLLVKPHNFGQKPETWFPILFCYSLVTPAPPIKSLKAVVSCGGGHFGQGGSRMQFPETAVAETLPTVCPHRMHIEA